MSKLLLNMLQGMISSLITLLVSQWLGLIRICPC